MKSESEGVVGAVVEPQGSGFSGDVGINIW